MCGFVLFFAFFFAFFFCITENVIMPVWFIFYCWFVGKCWLVRWGFVSSVFGKYGLPVCVFLNDVGKCWFASTGLNS